MTITVYDLTGADRSRRFSPYCWRAKLALAHKGLAFETVPTRFCEISSVLDGSYRTVPVLVDGETAVGDSWRIAEYLEETYADHSSLFSGPAGLGFARFIDRWAGAAVYGALFTMVVKDIWDGLDEESQGYFRASREKRLGRTMEEAQAGRDTAVAGFRKGLAPLRSVVEQQAFLGGASATYADYIVFAGFVWAMAVSDFAFLEEGDAVAGWLERCFDLHGGLAREIL